MKKITFLVAFLTMSLGFSQELLTNGDFENGSTSWTGNAEGGTGLNIVDDGSGNFVNEAIIISASEVWQVNLQQVVALTQGQDYQLTYDAYFTDTTEPIDTQSTMIVGVAENFGGFAGGDTVNPMLTTSSQSFSHVLTFNNASTTNGRVFFDMGGAANHNKTIIIDNVSLTEFVADPTIDATLSALEVDSNPVPSFNSLTFSYTIGLPPSTTAVPLVTNATATEAASGATVSITDATSIPGTATVVVTASDMTTMQTYTINYVSEGPATAAPTPPARDAANVVSIFSDAYAEIPGINFDAGFCGPNAVTATTAGGDPIFAYTGQACQGIDFSGSPQDITGFTNIHVDLFIEAGTDLIGKVFNILVVHPDGLGDTPVNIDLNAVTPAPVPGTWFSFDRVVTFNNPTVRQVTVVSNLNNDVWYDNLYIHNNVVLSTNDFETAQFTVAPNPTKDVWTIESNNTIDTIEVFDILGKSVITLNPNNQNASIEASGLKTGIYLAKLYSNGGFKTVRLVKN